MNSLDPWRVLAADPYGNAVVPRPYYGHPFHKEVPSWIHYGGVADGTTRQLFDGVFVGSQGASSNVSGWTDIIGAEMTNILGAELTALSVPASYYRRPFYRSFDPSYYGRPFYRSFGPFYRPFGPFIGADVPAIPVAPTASLDPGRTGLLAEIAPIVAPATGGISIKKELDERQVLHVEICVDGKCYRTSMDLAPAIEMIMQKFAARHQGMHPIEQPAPAAVVNTIENAIATAGDAIGEVLVGRHIAVMTGGWLSDIGGAIGGTLRKLAPVISTVATGVATVYGGPAAGVAASQLVPRITGLQADLLDPRGSASSKAAASRALQRINRQAAANPTQAQALAAANEAVKNTTVAYHVKDTAEKAIEGDPVAEQELGNLTTAAEEGDPAAQSTFELLATILGQELMKSEAGAKLWEQITGRGPSVISPGVSGWYNVAGSTYAG